MEADIYFFYDITPNKSGGVYDMPTSKRAPFSITSRDDTWGRMYLEHLKVKNAAALPNASDRYYTLHAQSYNVYGDFVDIPVRGTSATLLKYAFITYMCIVPINASNYGKLWFYHVNRVIPLPDKYRLYITPDNWANYIGYADIHNVNVSKSVFVLNPYLAALTNSLKSVGRPNLLKTPIRKYFTNQIAPGANVKLSDLRIYAVVNYVAYSDNSKELQSFKQEVYSFIPSSILGKTITTRFELISAIGAVQSIYGIESTIPPTPQPCSISNMYIFDRTLGGTIADETGTQSFRCIKLGAEATISGNPIDIGERKININLICGGGYFSQITSDIKVDPGHVMYIGVEDNRQDLPQFIGATYAKFKASVNFDSIKFTVETSQGAKDITQAYSVAVSQSTNTALTTNEQIAKTLQIISNFVSAGAQVFGGAASLSKGNITGITSITSGGLSLANAVVGANIDRGANPSFIQGGNALITYKDIFDNPNQSSSIYFLQGDWNGLNLETDIYFNGAAIDYNIYEASDFDFFDYFYRLHTLNYYYVDNVKNGALQLTCDINAIPADAADEIQAKFNEGVRINFVTDTN